MQHTNPLQIESGLVTELVRLGWQPIPGTDPTLSGIDGGPNSKYPLIRLRKVRNDYSVIKTRVVLEVFGRNRILEGIKSRQHVVNTANARWKHSLGRWFGARVMELLPHHEQWRQEKESARNRALAEIEAIKKIHPCSDGVAHAVISRALINFKKTPTGDLYVFAITFAVSHMSHNYSGDGAQPATAHLIQLLNIVEKDSPLRF